MEGYKSGNSSDICSFPIVLYMIRSPRLSTSRRMGKSCLTGGSQGLHESRWEIRYLSKSSLEEEKGERGRFSDLLMS